MKEYGELMSAIRKNQAESGSKWPLEKIKAMIRGKEIFFETQWNSKTGLVEVKKEGEEEWRSTGQRADNGQKAYASACETIHGLYGFSGVDIKTKV
ncbi:hypothetical protein A2468_07610 [Candidatus Falkowbacteria bacterium RIFOXYC2_FULL_46_15]|nr:MAG: hypothetical protein A2468_07610 [Candidatus Falkowbacteria bacterium RIFOXYC2_FULL_46_15]